jgi:hypothetical protein
VRRRQVGPISAHLLCQQAENLALAHYPGYVGTADLSIVRGVCVMLKFAAAALAMSLASAAYAQSNKGASVTDAQAVAEIIRLSRAQFATHGQCACPDDRDRDGTICGRRSAYSRPGGPLCYPRDVTPAMIADYRAGRL